ncbi:MAG: ArsR family transcriptional regulator [Ponticaulis sp.]|nr:ArsR family transcriptional regulator [Ponticaulis sp.]
MTEITKSFDSLPPAIQRFVLQWGDMGTQWGVNRSVAQIHALLYVSEEPLTAEDISNVLGIARSNVSNSIKELLGWKIIQRQPVPGDRRDHFIAQTDVWDVAMKIAAVRKSREIDPAIETLKFCLEQAETDTRISKAQKQRLEAMFDFTSTMDRWYGQMLKVPTGVLLRLIRMGDKIVSIAGFGSKSGTKEKT